MRFVGGALICCSVMLRFFNTRRCGRQQPAKHLCGGGPRSKNRAWRAEHDIRLITRHAI
jgi:hypothetical protein